MIRRLLPLLPLATLGSPAAAQIGPSFGVEVTNDEVRRGLSWSGGRASASADGGIALGPVEASVRAVMLRGSERHADADAVIDAGLATTFDAGAARIRLEGIHHIFEGARGKADYTEAGASASYSYGPVELTAGAMYAPSQGAIGGSNLHLYANANAGIPATPFTLVAGVGRSSGDVDDPVRAQRLRPDGTYLNWRLGAEYRLGFLTVALDYLGTDVSTSGIGPFADARHSGDRFVGRLRFGF